MPQMNRRNFLIASVGAAGLLSGAAVTLPQLLHHGQQRPLASDAGILVILTLYGGNDGINTVIPVTDNAYHDARRDLAFAPHEVLDLDGRLGLNPALTGLKDIWADNQLAIVRGVGYPKQDRSHFRSMDIWQTASPAAPASSGWIGRWLDSSGDDPLRAVNVGSVLPPLAVGEKHVAAGLSVSIPQIPDDVADTLDALSSPDPRDSPAMAAVRSNYKAYKTTDSAFSAFTDKPLPDPTVTAGRQLAEDLDLVAQCVKAGVPTRVYMVTLGGFDTHADERGEHQRLLTALDDALAPFLRQMGRTAHGRNVVVMVYSEFGRRVGANASQGTDHGTSGPVFIAGPRVKGGFYGDEPSLTDLDDGDLKTTTDFRDIYYELLSGTLSSDPEPSVGAGRKPIGFL
ncbi:uncharacterized protein RMCC_2097 [Mycolicibacterium canariasense]|uniref:DUF1501 domain-containing protein n=1 Tax=Mycolicibacterium canariasense TaxID=228230 RepID=A0A100WBT0_MYCCR|nr:DUF1501 domain-containing protein [Mycolicibacterium canariasense]MCV7209335.1 DUF1501 domain-containing protein [Mycolicibacterium canariasense]ORV05838.1 hypothetical protein AWB94_18130 [Mycolicibacterium canariasense]GAS95131.1 uncharacterized protein RMCC_2097 [Mycolicibacterium canariasense]